MNIPEFLGRYPKVLLMILMKMPIYRVIIFGLFLIIFFKVDNIDLLELVRLISRDE